MRQRLLILAFIAVVSGTVANVLAHATAGKARGSAGRAQAHLFGPCPIPDRFRPAFVRASHESQLPLALLTAVANVESKFEPDARSTAGAHGLLQMLPSTARALKLDASTPDKNVRAGARYLRMLLDQFKSTELAVAAYNAGPTAVEKAGGAPNQTTIAYVNEVMRLWRSLNGCR
jgi:soluble lytic murein transglycosylase-like protein